MDNGARPTFSRLNKRFGYLLGCSSLKMSTVGSFAVSFRILSRRKHMREDNVLFRNWYLLGVENISNHAYKTGSWYFLFFFSNYPPTSGVFTSSFCARNKVFALFQCRNVILLIVWRTLKCEVYMVLAGVVTFFSVMFFFFRKLLSVDSRKQTQELNFSMYLAFDEIIPTQ